MHLIFLLPDIQDTPTGGNLYNRHVVQALRHTDSVEEAVVPSNAPIPALPIRADSVLVLDSLLVERAESLRLAYPETNIVLLMHYLDICDPTHTASSRSLESGLPIFDGAITTSLFSKRCLVRAGMPPQRVFCVYPGLHPVFSPGSQPPREPILLTVANHLPGKGLVEFVAVLEAALTPGWRWQLIGSGHLDPPYSRLLHARLAGSPIAAQLDLLEPVGPETLARSYQKAALFALPTRFETLSMATREAMACGCPVIANDVGGLRESVDASCGMLIAQGNVEAWVDALVRLQSQDAIRHALGASAAEKAAGFNTWEDAGHQFRQALSALTSR